jgi:mono/diheme cytochrome c family protein
MHLLAWAYVLGAASSALVVSGLSGRAGQSPLDTGVVPPSIERGRQLVQSQCAACHAERGPPRTLYGPPAPTLVALKRRFTRGALEGRLKDIRENGHYDTPQDVYAMPAVDLVDKDFRDIAAYIQSLKGR